MDVTTTPLGAADCEAFAGGWLVQPVNAWSSLAYAVVGLVLIVASIRTGGRDRTLQTVYGVLLIGTGIGSFLYHGPQTPVAQFAHDITFLAALWALVLLNLAAAGLLPRRTLAPGLAAVLAVLSSVLLLWPASTNVLTGITVVALAASDLWRRRTVGFERVWYGASIVLLLGSLLFNALGRTGAPTCDPESVVQFHGLWHVLTALGLGTYFVGALSTKSGDAS